MNKENYLATISKFHSFKITQFGNFLRHIKLNKIPPSICYLLFSILRGAPRLVNQVEEGVKVTRIELPIIRAKTTQEQKTLVKPNKGSRKQMTRKHEGERYSLIRVAWEGSYFLSSSLLARALPSGQRCSRWYSIIHLLSLLCNSLVSFSTGDTETQLGMVRLFGSAHMMTHVNTHTHTHTHTHTQAPTTKWAPDHFEGLFTFPQSLQYHKVQLHLKPHNNTDIYCNNNNNNNQQPHITILFQVSLKRLVFPMDTTDIKPIIPPDVISKSICCDITSEMALTDGWWISQSPCW